MNVIRIGTGHAVPMTQKQKNTIIGAFLGRGHSTHSALAGCLAIIIEYCECNKLPYVLSAMPGVGYHVALGSTLPKPKEGDHGKQVL